MLSPVKYILGSSHNLLTPIAILLIKSDVWQMTKKVNVVSFLKIVISALTGLPSWRHHAGPQV